MAILDDMLAKTTIVKIMPYSVPILVFEVPLSGRDYPFIASGPRAIAATPVRATSTKPSGTINDMN